MFEPGTKSLQNTSLNSTKAITESSIENNKALENLNNKLLEIMIDRGILASHLMSPLSKITNPQNTSQYKKVKVSSSNRINDLSKHNTIPITLHDNLLTFRDTGKEIELKGDLSKMISNKNYNVDLATLSDEKLMYDFAKEMKFDVKSPGNKFTRYETLMKLPKSQGLMISASGVSKTIFLSPDPHKMCNRLRLLLQELQAGITFDIINEQIIAIVDKLLEYKCLSNKQHKQLSIQCNLLHE